MRWEGCVPCLRGVPSRQPPGGSPPGRRSVLVGDALRRRPGLSVRYRLFAAIRIGVGLYWLYEQHWKLPPDFGRHNPRGLMYAFQLSIDHPTFGLYKSFLQQVVVPHFYLFGWLIVLTETTIGLSLTLGLLTRLGALLGTLEAINLFLAEAATPEKPWLYIAIIAANLIVLLTRGNRVWSLDRKLQPWVATLAGSHPRLAGALRLAIAGV